MNTLDHKPVAFLCSGFKNTSAMKKLLFVHILGFLAVTAMAQPTLKEGCRMLENENYKGAADQFNAIAKADPKNGTIYYYIGEVSYQQDIPAEAEKAYKKGLSINSNCAECKVGLGKIAMDAGKTAEGHEYFESAMRLDKKNPEIFFLVGDAYLSSKHPDANKAVKYLGMARDMNYEVAKYWARLGDAYEMLGNNGEAMTHYETAVRKDPTNTAAYISIAAIWKAAKQYDTAIVYLKKAIDLSPNDAQPYKDLIELYILTNQLDQLPPVFARYTELAGDDIDAKVRQVKFLTFQAKDYDRAIEIGEPLLQAHPEQYTLHRWLAWAYGEKGMPQQSYDHSKMLFDEIGKDTSIRKAFSSDYEYWAKAAMKLDSLDEASHIYRKFIELEPSRAHEIYGLLAKAYSDAKNYEQAIAYYHRKAEVKPLSTIDNYYLGMAYFYTDQNLKSDSCFIQILTLTPNYAAGWLMRARNAEALDPEGKEALAFPFYKNYITFANEEVGKKGLTEGYKKGLNQAYRYVAIYHVQTDSLALARDEFMKAIEMDTTDSISKEYLDIVKEQMKGGK
jgi:tetratricopeptide (TPR) repeat protein